MTSPKLAVPLTPHVPPAVKRFLLPLVAAISIMVSSTILAPHPAGARESNQFPIAWTGIGIHPQLTPALDGQPAGEALSDGTLVTHLCETRGQSVFNGEVETDIWALTEYGWLPTAFIYTGVNDWTPGVPRCDADLPSEETAPDNAAAGCPEYLALGIPGSTQGIQHDYSDGSLNNLMGPEVFAAYSILKQEKDNLEPLVIAYPATLVADILTVDTYQTSKNQGYKEAYNTIDISAEQCKDTKFYILGYSQGAHIAGDLAQTILEESKPIDSGRLAGIVLLADPAFNPKSPGAEMYRFTDSGTIESTTASGSQGLFGARNEIDSDVPFVSVCIQGDPVCDIGDLAGMESRAAKAARFGRGIGYHTIYQIAPIPEEDGANLAEFAARSMIR